MPDTDKLHNLSDVRLFYQPADRLRMTTEDRSWHTVKPVWVAPLSHPGRYLALLDAKGDEIMTIPDASILDKESFETVMEELRRRDMTAEVREIISAKVEYGSTYWRVITDKGTRDFVTQNLQENAMWLDENHLMLVDADGNRFELSDIGHLDNRSKMILYSVV